MKPLLIKTISATCALFLASAAFGEDLASDRISVPLRDPSRPGTVKVSLMSGGITVKGYDGKEVVVEARARESKSEAKNDDKEQKTRNGLKRIDFGGVGLTAEEEDNVVSVSTGVNHRPVDLIVQVPFKTSLKISCMNDGDVYVEKVEGEIEANNLNGRITLTNVSGVVVAHSLNGEVKVKLERITPDKPMSFSTLNGDIDVTLPPDTKAKVKLETQNGDIFSDFEIGLEVTPRPPKVEDGRKDGGKYRVVLENARYGTINGGGAEFHFKTMAGSIQIRKGTQ